MHSSLAILIFHSSLMQCIPWLESIFLISNDTGYNFTLRTYISLYEVPWVACSSPKELSLLFFFCYHYLSYKNYMYYTIASRHIHLVNIVLFWTNMSLNLFRFLLPHADTVLIPTSHSNVLDIWRDNNTRVWHWIRHILLIMWEWDNCRPH